MPSFILLFDTQEETEVVHCRVIIAGQEQALCRVVFASHDSQALLSQVICALQEQDLSWTDLSAVAVLHGCERFTISRLTVAVANAIGWSMRIPVLSYVQQPTITEIVQDAAHTAPAHPIEAVYSKEPTMTISG